MAKLAFETAREPYLHVPTTLRAHTAVLCRRASAGSRLLSPGSLALHGRTKARVVGHCRYAARLISLAIESLQFSNGFHFHGLYFHGDAKRPMKKNYVVLAEQWRLFINCCPHARTHALPGESEFVLSPEKVPVRRTLDCRRNFERIS